MTQTAIEWLVEQMMNSDFIFDEIDIQLFQQAKEMEKQQIIDACYFGSQNLPYEVKDKSEQYYNQTFNK